MLPVPNQNESYVRVHPDFRAIFTSNPQEYSGVHDAQDALSDRMVMIDVDYLDRETELAITAARSGLPVSKVERIVDLVRDYRASGEYDQAPTLRGSIMIATRRRRPEPAGFVAPIPASSRPASICSARDRHSKADRTDERAAAAQNVDELDRSITVRPGGARMKVPAERVAAKIGAGAMATARSAQIGRRRRRRWHMSGDCMKPAGFVRSASPAPTPIAASLPAMLARLDHQRGLLERQLAVWTEKQQVTKLRLSVLEKKSRRSGG